MTSESVQEAFRLSVNVLRQNSDGSVQSVQVGTEGVKAIFESCLDWESSRPVRGARLTHCPNSLIQGGMDTLPTFFN